MRTSVSRSRLSWPGFWASCPKTKSRALNYKELGPRVEGFLGKMPKIAIFEGARPVVHDPEGVRPAPPAAARKRYVKTRWTGPPSAISRTSILRTRLRAAERHGRLNGRWYNWSGVNHDGSRRD
jgi:hypothetical protein